MYSEDWSEDPSLQSPKRLELGLGLVFDLVMMHGVRQIVFWNNEHSRLNSSCHGILFVYSLSISDMLKSKIQVTSANFWLICAIYTTHILHCQHSSSLQTTCFHQAGRSWNPACRQNSCLLIYFSPCANYLLVGHIRFSLKWFIYHLPLLL